MTVKLILDTGPLIALLDRRDKYHEWTKIQVVAALPPFLTCEAVIAEPCYLRRHLPHGVAAVMEMIRRRVVSIPFAIESQAAAVAALADRYSDTPMSLADACLVRMAELHDAHSVLTLDADFRVYRMHRRRQIPVIMPDNR